MTTTTTLLQQIFNQLPAVLGETYVESSINDVRYSVANSSHFAVERAKIPKNAPGWLRNDPTLGPYEKEIFSNILTGPDALFALRGGSGSGKSSLAAALDKRAHRLTTAIPRNGDDTWSEKSGYSTFFSLVNLQAAVDYSVDGRNTKKYNAKLQNGFLDWVADLLLDMVFSRLCISENELALLLDYFCKDEYNIHGYVQSFKMLFVERIENTKDFRPPAITRIWRDCAQDLDATQRLNVVVSLMCSAARRLRGLSRFNDKKYAKTQNLVVCLDNTDRVRPDLLRPLLIQMKSLFEQEQYKSSGLKIVFFMRLSTSRDVIGALPDLPMRQFSSPDPQDIIIPKIVGFLYYQKDLSELFDEKVIRETKYRLLEFIIRISDPYDKVYDLLLSFAGTNIRLFYKQLIKLVAAPTFRPRITNETEFNSYLPKLHDFVSDVMFLRLGMKASDNILDNIDATETSDHEHLETLLQNIAFDLCVTIRSLINSQEQTGINISGRIFGGAGLTEVLRRRLEEINSDHTRSPFTEKIFERMLSGALNELADSVRNTIVADESGVSAPVMDVINRLPDMCFEVAGRLDGFSERDSDFIRSYARSFVTKLATLASSEESDPSLVFERSKLRFLMPKINVGEKASPSGFPIAVQTRYELTKILLGKRADHTDNDELPINLFSSSPQEGYAPIPLKVVYALGCFSEAEKIGENPADVTKEAICSLIGRQGHDKEAINRAFGQIATDNNRLIYSTVMDNLEMADHGFLSIPNSSIVHLSWSGLRYYRRLTQNFHYIQWCLTHIDPLVAEVFDNRQISVTEGVTDITPPFGAYEPYINEASTGKTVSEFFKLVDFVSERRRGIRYNIVSPDIVTPKGRELLFRHAFPEVDILMKIAPDLQGVLTYQMGMAGKFAETARQVRKELTDRATEICEWGADIHGERVEAWDESLALIVR